MNKKFIILVSIYKIKDLPNNQVKTKFHLNFIATDMKK